jgi:very-short-patch-repair endonuclease
MAYLGKTRIPAYYYNADEETVDFAKKLRKQMTLTEKLLWEKLRRKSISGVKFRRQHPIGFYIADFYCHEARLVIEVDGAIHSLPGRKEHDGNRDAEMKRLGIQVLRFSNDEIQNNLDNVIKLIEKEINQIIENRKVYF